MILGKYDNGKDFKLPIELVTQTIAILAKRGVGKTYTGSVMAEEMLEAGQQIAAIDPTGAWSGLRSSADGKHAGYPVVVFGGERADVPLQEHAGEVIATAMVERRFSAIIDLSLFRKGQARRFVTAFLETLYRLNREPLHLFVDEADDIAPQKPMGDEAQMLGAIEDIVKRGRKKGIGCTLITQRPADLAKQVLTQCEMLVTLRIVHPRDINAIKEWVNVHADPQEAKDMIASLPSLPIGNAWFWSPGWGDLFGLVHVRKRLTFDSSATPKPGEKARKPSVLAPVDIKVLGEQIGKTAEEARANDPRELRRRVADLERQLAEASKVKPGKTEIKRVEVPILKEQQVKRLEAVCNKLGEPLRENLDRVVQVFGECTRRVMELRDEISAAARKTAIVPVFETPNATIGVAMVHKNTHTKPSRGPVTAGDMSRPIQRVLDGIAWWNSLGVKQPTREQVAFVSGSRPTSGHYANTLGSARTAGLIEYPATGQLELTDPGRNKAVHPVSNPTRGEVVERARRILSGPELRIFDAIVQAGGDISRDDLAASSGFSATSGHFANTLGSMRSAGLIDYPGSGMVKLSEAFS